MYDYIRMFIENEEQINIILSNPLLNFKQVFDKNSAELFEYPQKTKWQNWVFDVFSPTHLTIMGSIHKFYTDGSNANDFTFTDASAAINLFCRKFNLQPTLARIENLEFGVNVKPIKPASDIIDQVICYKNTRPIRPYESRKDYYFIEFDVGEYYVKLYDKGKQYGGPNILRFEIKAVKNRYLKFANITTLQDLLSLRAMKLLGVKINEVFKHVVFNDSSIQYRLLSNPDKKVYLLMKDANEWAKDKKRRTTTNRDRERRFKEIVDRTGSGNFFKDTQIFIMSKVKELVKESNPADFTSKYMVKTDVSILTKTPCSVSIFCPPFPSKSMSLTIFPLFYTPNSYLNSIPVDWENQVTTSVVIEPIVRTFR